jgi:hypothetical protein
MPCESFCTLFSRVQSYTLIDWKKKVKLMMKVV